MAGAVLRLGYERFLLARSPCETPLEIYAYNVSSAISQWTLISPWLSHDSSHWPRGLKGRRWIAVAGEKLQKMYSVVRLLLRSRCPITSSPDLLIQCSKALSRCEVSSRSRPDFQRLSLLLYRCSSPGRQALTG